MFDLPSVKDKLSKTVARRRIGSFGQFIEKYQKKTYAKGQTILLQNETPSGVFIIESGKVRTYIISPDGHEQLISIHSRGEDIPVGFAFGFSDKSQYFYEAYTKCNLRLVPVEDFVRLVFSNPDLMYQMYFYSVKQLSSSLTRVHALGQSRASNKIALTLIYLADRLGMRSWAKPKFLEISVTQEEIANSLGVTRETVSSELNKLRVNKVISYSRKRYVLYTERIKKHLRND